VFFQFSPETKKFALKLLCIFGILSDLRMKKFILSVRSLGCVTDFFVGRSAVFFGLLLA
jgi:hypothetical protein